MMQCVDEFLCSEHVEVLHRLPSAKDVFKGEDPISIFKKELRLLIQEITSQHSGGSVSSSKQLIEDNLVQYFGKKNAFINCSLVQYFQD